VLLGATSTPVRRRRRPAAVALLALVISVGAVAALVGMASGGRAPAVKRGSAKPAPPGTLVFRSRGRTLASFDLARFTSAHGVRHARLRRAVARAIPREAVTYVRRTRVIVAYDRATALRAAARATRNGATVTIRARPLAATIPTRVVKQRLRNDCEATALQMLLAGVAVRAPQLDVQRRLPRSGPLDPVERGNRTTWGDPALGFVGRPNGGGPAGGFGVYHGPIAYVAHTYGVALHNLTGASVATILGRVRSGHAVMAWVGLSDGPYGHWYSPAGKAIDVNFGEHAVVITQIDRNGTLSIADPLTGTSLQWSRAEFAAKWQRLGRQALST
jgi:uncharacterized protein YvpB